MSASIIFDFVTGTLPDHLAHGPISTRAGARLTPSPGAPHPVSGAVVCPLGCGSRSEGVV